MSYRLRPRAEIEAAIASPAFNALPLTRKRQLAEQVIAVQLDLDLVLPVLIGQAGTDLEARFLLALVIQVDGSGNPNAPVAAFTATPSSGQAPLSVLFSDGSTGQISSRLWNFGDGTTIAAQSPTHVFGAAGSYNVALTVAGPGGSRTATHPVTVTAAPTGGGGSGDERTGVLNIPVGATEVAVVFTPPFASAPLPPACEVVVPAGGDHITVAGVQGLTAAGCTVLLTAATPAAGYQLGFRALHP